MDVRGQRPVGAQATELLVPSRVARGRRPPARVGDEDLHHPRARALHQARGLLRPVLGVRGATDVEGYEDRAVALRIPANAQAGR